MAEPKRAEAPLPWRIAEARSNAVYIEDADGATLIRIVYPDRALDIAVNLLRAVNGEAKLREALRFYAAPECWANDSEDRPWTDAQADRGAKARAALAASEDSK